MHGWLHTRDTGEGKRQLGANWYLMTENFGVQGVRNLGDRGKRRKSSLCWAQVEDSRKWGEAMPASL